MGNKPPQNKKDPPTQYLELVPVTGAGIPAGFCQSQSFLPWVSQQSNGAPSTQLICAKELQLNIPNYKQYNYGGQHSNYLSQRMFFQPLDVFGQTVDIFNVDRYCLSPQGCTILQIVCVQIPLPPIPISPQSAVDFYSNSLKANADSGRIVNKNLYSYGYILKIQDMYGNQHYVYEADQYVSGQRATKYDASMLPDFMPNTGNMIIGGSVNIAGIAAYAVFDMPGGDSVAYSLYQDPQYALKTNSASWSGGGYLTFYQQATPGSVQLPPGMSIIGIGCMRDCTSPVIIAGYKYELQDVLNFQVGTGFPMLKYVTTKYGKQEVYSYIVAMLQWAYNIGLQYFTADQAKKINDMLGLIISGQYGLYGDVNLFNGKIDDYMAYYCSLNKDKPICACYVSTSPTPMCSDRTCQTVGYRSSKILAQNCDPYNNLDTIKGLVNTAGNTAAAQYQAMLDQQAKTQSGLVATQQSIATSQDQLQQQMQQQSTQLQSQIQQQLAVQQKYMGDQLMQQEQYTTAQLTAYSQLLQQALNDLSANTGKQLTDQQIMVLQLLQQQQDAINKQLADAQKVADNRLADSQKQQNIQFDNQQQSIAALLKNQSDQIKQQMTDQNVSFTQQLQQQQQQLQDHQKILTSMIQSSQESVAQQLSRQSTELSKSLTESQDEFTKKGDQLTKNMDNVNTLVAQFGQQYLSFKDYLDTLHTDGQTISKQLSEHADIEKTTHENQKNMFIVVMFLIVLVMALSMVSYQKIVNFGKYVQRFSDRIFDISPK